MYTYNPSHATVHVWGTEDSLQELILYFCLGLQERNSSCQAYAARALTRWTACQPKTISYKSLLLYQPTNMRNISEYANNFSCTILVPVIYSYFLFWSSLHMSQTSPYLLPLSAFLYCWVYLYVQCSLMRTSFSPCWRIMPSHFRAVPHPTYAAAACFLSITLPIWTSTLSHIVLFLEANQISQVK